MDERKKKNQRALVLLTGYGNREKKSYKWMKPREDGAMLN